MSLSLQRGHEALNDGSPNTGFRIGGVVLLLEVADDKSNSLVALLVGDHLLNDAIELLPVLFGNPTLYSGAFGQHDDVHAYLGGHSGIDISTSYGDPVCAAHDGTIAGIDKDPMGTSDPPPYITETPEHPEGDLSGNAVVLGNIANFLSRFRLSA
jgi:murein DD-endopeptidase MepM/ murein hydrolase activator NlpD